MFAVIMVVIGLAIFFGTIGGLVGFFLGKQYGEELAEKKYAKPSQWKKKEKVTYEVEND